MVEEENDREGLLVRTENALFREMIALRMEIIVVQKIPLSLPVCQIGPVMLHNRHKMMHNLLIFLIGYVRPNRRAKLHLPLIALVLLHRNRMMQ